MAIARALDRTLVLPHVWSGWLAYSAGSPVWVQHPVALDGHGLFEAPTYEQHQDPEEFGPRVAYRHDYS